VWEEQPESPVRFGTGEKGYRFGVRFGGAEVLVQLYMPQGLLQSSFQVLQSVHKWHGQGPWQPWPVLHRYGYRFGVHHPPLGVVGLLMNVGSV
jgi:hypothetical protein